MTVDPIERLNLAFAASAVAASFVWATPVFALSLAVGAALEAFNFRGLLRSSPVPSSGARSRAAARGSASTDCASACSVIGIGSPCTSAPTRWVC